MPRADDDADIFEIDPRDARNRRRSAPPSSKSSSLGCILWGLGGGALLLFLVCCGGGFFFYRAFLKPTDFGPQTQEYADARKAFQTKLTRQGPAPQTYVREEPLDDVEVVEYESGGLKLTAWVDPAPAAPDAIVEKKPAVLFLHGGFAFGAEDWDGVQPFRDAGFVVMIPILRGENGQPGSYSMFFHEIDDVLAAAEALATRPNVDPKRLCVAGHSVGGTLAMLAAMASDRFVAAASFSGSPDQIMWSRTQPEVVPFDQSDRNEMAIRSPLAWPLSFRCPSRLYFGNEEFLFSAPTNLLAEKAIAAGRDVLAVEVGGDHFTSLDAAVPQAIAFFRAKTNGR